MKAYTKPSHIGYRRSSLAPGFTLVELLVVVVLFVLLVPIMIISLSTIGSLNRSAKITSEINSVVQSQVELIRARPFDDVAVGTSDFTSKLSSSVGSPRSATYTVTLVSGKTDLKRIYIQISYTNGVYARNVSYSTYINREITP